MKRLLIALLLLGTATLYAQNNFIDSLRYQLVNAIHDTTRVQLMSDLSYYYRNVKPDSALEYGKKALALAQKSKYTWGETSTLSRLSFAFRESGDLPKALEIAYKALNMAEQHQFEREIGVATAMIGNVYYDLKQFPTAITYWKRGLEIAKQSGDEKQVSIRYAIIGEAYIHNGQMDSAMHYLQPAYRDILRLKMADFYPYIYRYLGLVEDKLNNNQSALSYFRQGVQTSLQIDDHRNAAINYNFIATFYQKLNRPDSCIVYALKALEQAQRGPFILRIMESSTILTNAYKQKQDFQNAFIYQELMLKTKETLFGAGNIQAMQIMVANEEKRQQEVAQAKIAYENRLKQYGLLAGLGIVLLITFLLYRNNRQKHQANNLLNEQKTKVEQTLATLRTTQNQLIQREKMASLGELTAGVAHEIQNPLNFVNNFSELSIDLALELKEEREKKSEQRDEELMDDLINDIVQNQEKISLHGKRAAGIIKGMLEHSKTSTGKKELTDINALAEEYLKLSYHGMLAKDKDSPTNRFKSDFSTDFTMDLPLAELIPQDFGRVLLNLFNNAFYAVSVARTGSPLVEVSTRNLADTIEIRIKDNGPGIPENIKAKIFQPFFTTKPTGEGTGLGLSLAYDIITKGHGGTIEVESVQGKGSTFIVKLPV